MMEMFMHYGGQELSRADFGDDLQSKVAFTVAFYSGVSCGSKKAALDLLNVAAEGIISDVRSDTE